MSTTFQNQFYNILNKVENYNSKLSSLSGGTALPTGPRTQEPSNDDRELYKEIARLLYQRGGYENDPKRCIHDARAIIKNSQHKEDVALSARKKASGYHDKGPAHLEESLSVFDDYSGPSFR